MPVCVCLCVCACVCVVHVLLQDATQYRSHERPHIKQWLDDISRLGGGCGGHAPAMSLIIYCVTAAVRARKQHILNTYPIEERVRADYKNMADE